MEDSVDLFFLPASLCACPRRGQRGVTGGTRRRHTGQPGTLPGSGHQQQRWEEGVRVQERDYTERKASVTPCVDAYVNVIKR